MSYRVLRVNDLTPDAENNLDVTLTGLVTGSPVSGDIPVKQGAVWGSATVSGDPPMTSMYAHFSTAVNYSPKTLWPLDTTDWAYIWPTTFVNSVTQRFYDTATIVNVTNPPAYLNARTDWAMGVRLTEGTYLIQAVPTMRIGAVTMRLYHTPANSLSGTYVGNEIYYNADDGKTGTTLTAHVTITETRRFFVRVSSGAGNHFSNTSFQSTFWHIQRVES